MTVWLIGFMGSGKSCIGELLATRLGYDFVDSDVRISQEVGLSVDAIFSLYGSAHFRNLEAQCIAGLDTRSHCVVATGGGMPIYNALGAGVVCYLQADFEVLHARLLQDDLSRPLFKSKEALYRLYVERAPLYAHLAQYTINANQPPPQVVAQILKVLDQDKL
ncbi:shikimate kinase [Helicobacter vulpis]|uniref:shikimate kinase n=1 Tax=Helicobacter vulpis TaxID=2316076 RepID=UPI000EB4FA9B|nr:shikimate kinase [Helicobacter vulpis]